MPSEFPPSLSGRVKVAAAVVLLVTFAYSFVIAGQILLWFVLAGIAGGLYVAWLLVHAVFRLVEAVERLAAAKEAEAGGTDRAAEADAGSVGAERSDAGNVGAERSDAGRPDAERTGGNNGAGRGTDRDAFDGDR